MSDGRKEVIDISHKMSNRNSEGYYDPTAWKALSDVDREKRKLDELVRTIYYIANLAGFDIDERIVFVNKKSGRVWR